MRTGFVGMLFFLSGCASAMPALVGGTTTPSERTDLIVGGAARLPIGQASVPEQVSRGASHAIGAGGIVPVAAFRRGLSDRWDLGLMVAGTEGRFELRTQRFRSRGVTTKTTIFAFALTGGYVDDPEGDGRGARFGFDMPIAWSVDIGGVYELWLGPRFGLEHVRGDFSPTAGENSDSAQATSVRGGAVLGVGLGFRRFAVRLEVSIYYEHWLGDVAGESFSEGGFILLPAFAMRLRL